MTGATEMQFSLLATRILYTRVKLMCAKKDDASVKAAIDIAFDYFSKNEVAAGGDLKRVFP